MAKPAQTVEAWMAALDHPAKPGIEALRALILASHEGVTEHIKWSGPSFCHGGDDRMTIGLDPKGAIRVIIHRGVKVRDTAGFEFEDTSGLVKWAAPDRGVITLLDAAAVEANSAALSDLARRWIDAAS